MTMGNKQAQREKSHAEQNAEGHAESILELYRAHKALEGGAEKAAVEGDEYTEQDQIVERAMESALSVEVRSGWYIRDAGKGAHKPAEFNILLSWGGPALRIVGDLTEHGEPDGEPTLQHQDWGTPWTDYRPDVADQDDWEAALQWFVGCFYFGETMTLLVTTPNGSQWMCRTNETTAEGQCAHIERCIPRQIGGGRGRIRAYPDGSVRWCGCGSYGRALHTTWTMVR